MPKNQLERMAYLAAHQILTSDMSHCDLACPGARRSRMIDDIANIIISVAEAAYGDAATPIQAADPKPIAIAR